MTTYEDLIENIASGKPFSFSRWGDGEFNAMLGKRGANCDGHHYFPDMGQALVNVLDSQREDQTYYLGMQNLAKRLNGELPAFQEMTEGIDWINADIIHRHSINNNGIPELFEALGGKSVTLVGGLHLMPLADENRWRFIDIPAKDCWTQYDETAKRIGGVISDNNGVFLYCASMMANVLIDKTANPLLVDLTNIDIGSAFDPYVGKLSRSYHKKMKL